MLINRLLISINFEKKYHSKKEKGKKNIFDLYSPLCDHKRNLMVSKSIHKYLDSAYDACGSVLDDAMNTNNCALCYST